MALEIKKSLTLNGTSKIDGVAAERYTAVINSDKPEDMTISSYQMDKNVYKANRVQCRLDSAEFEEAAYALQDEMIAKNVESNKTEEAAERTK